VSIQISFAGGQSRLDLFGALLADVLHVGESLCLEKLLGQVLGALADAGNPNHPEPRRLGRRLGSGTGRAESMKR